MGGLERGDLRKIFASRKMFIESRLERIKEGKIGGIFAKFAEDHSQ